MKLEDQVASVEPSKELRELSVKQDSVFAWYQYVKGKPYIALKALQNCQDSIATYHDGYAECPKEICDAPTVAELGEMLPNDYVTYKTLFIPKRTVWCCASPENAIDMLYEYAKTEANARAKMLIYLIKEGIMKAEEIK